MPQNSGGPATPKYFATENKSTSPDRSDPEMNVTHTYSIANPMQYMYVRI